MMFVESFAASLADARERRQQDPARLQDSPKGLDRRSCVVDEMKRLRANYSVERIRRHVVGPGEISDYGRPPVVLLDVEHIACGDVPASVFPGVEGVLDLQHPPSDVLAMAGEKPFDVVT